MDTPLLTNDVTDKPKVYFTRWYVLCCLSLLSCIQNVIWIGYGPVAQSAKAVYDWSDTMVDMLVNFGNIACIIAIIPASWVLDVKGLRLSMLWGTIVVAIGSGLRCISSDPTYARWLITVGQTLNGAGGTVANAGATLLSVTWFPPYERGTATAISILFSSIGSGIAFILGPQFVTEPNFVNCTGILNVSLCNSTNATIVSNLATLTKEIMLLNYIEFGMAAFLMLMVMIYYPNAPPSPPSETANTKRTNFKEGTKKLIKMLKFWHVAFAFALPTGVYGSWGSVLDVNLKPFGISQTEAGWLGFYSSMGGTAFGILLSRFSDIFMKRIKQFLIVVYSLAAVFYLCFTLMCSGVIYHYTGLFYFFCIAGGTLVNGAFPLFFELSCETTYPIAEGITAGFLTLALNITGSLFLLLSLIPNIGLFYFFCIAGGTLVNGAFPLFFELSCETTYPIAEGITAGFLTLALNITGSLFLLLSLIPNIGTVWPNWTLIACVGGTVPLLVLFKADYKRIYIDMLADKMN